MTIARLDPGSFVVALLCVMHFLPDTLKDNPNSSFVQAGVLVESAVGTEVVIISVLRQLLPQFFFTPSWSMTFIQSFQETGSENHPRSFSCGGSVLVSQQRNIWGKMQ